jgi:hypothetical protein
MSASASKKQRKCDVTKDPLDLRDLMYEGSLGELTYRIDNRRRVPVILDQGREGACTGFGLAAVVNFLIYNRSDTSAAMRKKLRDHRNGASPRMLYEMAKRYDEWKGENYDGSSVRGAMKGWLRHGVCQWQSWPYDPRQPGRLTPQRQLEALDRPLGAYLRVRHLHLNQMHGALNEAGVLLASASVHRGWHDVDPETGNIPYSSELIGGHAFAIVGYDDVGFWIQNSWGPDWGKNGFCRISYDDWLENGYDCWVARLGVPTKSLAMDGEAQRDRVAAFDHIPHEAVVLAKIRPHFVNLGNEGRFSESGIYATDATELEDVVLEDFRSAAKEWGRSGRLLLYAHGGLNNEKASASRIATLQPYFVENRIYPIHFMWETGLGDSIKGIVQDAFRSDRFGGWRDSMREKFYDLIDEGVELGARGLGRPVWSEMKENAARATLLADGGARYTAQRIGATLDGLSPAPQVHLVGHSAGSILLGQLTPYLVELGIPIKSLILFAPACSTGFFKTNVLPHLGKGIERMAIFNLADAVEQDDSVGSLYHKSLLYLVSQSLETQRATPLLGMEKFWKDEPALSRALSRRKRDDDKTVIRVAGIPDSLRLSSKSTTHGGFDNDEETLNATLRIVTGKNALLKRFETAG